MRTPLILIMILSAIWIISILIPAKSKEGERIKAIVWVTCYVLITLIAVYTYIFIWSPDINDPWMDLP